MQIYFKKGVMRGGVLVHEFDVDLNDLSAFDISEIKREWARRGNVSPMVALDHDFALMCVARAMGVPYEDLMASMTGAEYVKIGQSAVNFLLTGD